MQFFKPARLLLLLGVSSKARTASAYDCFDADGTDLKTQVNAYTANPSGYSSSKYGPFEDWCTTPVTTMRELFYNKADFNANITAWDTSSVTDMSYMFYHASAFNQDLSAWNTSSVTDMGYMFYYASAFNQNLSAWDTSKVTNIYMFHGAHAFNGDISTWDTSSVTDMSLMFNGAHAFNQDLSTWDTSSVTNMYRMFFYASAFNQNLCAWKDKFPYSNAAQIFENSGCTDQTTPISDQSAFCAGSAEVCQAYTAATPVPTNSPTKSPTNSPTKLPTKSPTNSPTPDAAAPISSWALEFDSLSSDFDKD
eukprot:scaffold8540_cov156-Skeletonema_dohrnii-CCMP3373.AAC.1